MYGTMAGVAQFYLDMLLAAGGYPKSNVDFKRKSSSGPWGLLLRWIREMA